MADEPQDMTVEQVAAQYSARRAEAAEKAEKPAEKVEKIAPEKAAPVIEESEPESADTGDGDEENIAEALEQEPTTAPTLTMPPGWGEADKETWSGLTPEAQKRVLEREKARDAGIQKQLQKVTEAQKAAEAELARAKAERQRSGPPPSTAVAMIIAELTRDFPDVNPQDPNSMVKFALEHPERKVVFDERWRQLGQAMHQQKQDEAKQFAESEAQQAAFETARAEELRSLMPELADEKVSQAFETAVVGYLTNDNKVPADRLRHYTATELLMAEKARKYDKAMAGLKAKPQTEVPKVVRPGAPREGGKSDEVVALEKQAKRSGKLDDVLALRRAREAKRA